MELRHRLRDVHDHTIRGRARGGRSGALLQNALTDATLVAQEQNEEMRRVTEASYLQSEQVKRISSWAAILFAPTLVGTIYGMNFRHMPELGWALGYPFALLAMLGMGVVLYVVFKRHHWL
ncbi:CorA family divalent cation transporter [Georgenia sp. SUBG003]|uniref:CorA family divalent cation transporter n=1 Tax=Georgenia sp. SUBG003 TaxID=1497974 RepID=UPI000A67D742